MDAVAAVFRDAIEAYDHWVAFALLDVDSLGVVLVAIGARILVEPLSGAA